MTREELEALRALEQAATPGPWRVATATVYASSGDDPYGREIADLSCADSRQTNAALIAAMRNALPRLLDEVDDAKQRATSYKSALKAANDELLRVESLRSRIGRIAELEQQLAAVTAERDQALADLAEPD